MFTIRVAGRPIQVRLVAPTSAELVEGEVVGVFRSCKDTVCIDQTLTSRQKFVSLVHELSHAVHDTTQIEIIDNNRRYVDVERSCDVTGYLVAELLEQIDIIPDDFLEWLDN